MSANLMQALGGFGLFLLSLRFLNNILATSVSNSLRPFLKRILANRFFCVLVGFIATVLVQASSISIITAMGLLSTSLITLEQGFLLMLGATLGTTAKSWVFAIAIHEYGVLIVGIASISLIFIKNPFARQTLEAIIAIGLAFLALNLLSTGLKPLLSEPQIQVLFRSYKADSIPAQLWIVLVSCLVTMALQSSSAVVFLVLELAREGVISMPTGAAFILGANIGTTITPLIASLEYNRNVKRLAVSHVLVKILGVFIAILFLPAFLTSVDYIVPGKTGENLIMHLAAVHSLFNLFNVIAWSSLSSLAVRFLFTIIPSQAYDRESQSILPMRVRRMLARHPDRAFQEIEKQMSRLEDMTKSIVDHSLTLLIEGKNGGKSSNSMLMTRRFESFKEVIYDLLTHLKQNQLSPEQNRKIEQQLHMLGDFTNFYHLNLCFKDHVEKGVMIDFYEVPSEIKNLFQEFQKGFNEIWLKIVLGNLSTKFGTNLEGIIKDLENVYFFYLSKHEGVNRQQLFWLYEIIRYQRHIAMTFLMLYEGTKMKS